MATDENEELKEFTEAIEAVAAKDAPADDKSDEPKSPDDGQQGAEEGGEKSPADDSDAKTGDNQDDEGEPEDDGVPEALVKKAAEYDISKEELKEFGDNAEAMVEQIGRLYDRKVAEFGRQIAMQKPPEEGGHKKGDGEQSPDGQEAPNVVKMLLDSGYEEDEPVVQAVKMLSEQNAAMMEKLSTAPANAGDSGAADPAILKEVQGFFDSVPKEYKDLVGKGHDLKPDSAEYKLREAILDTAAVLDVGYQAQGKTLEIKDLLQKAFAQHTVERAKELARKELAGKLKKRNRNASTPPSGAKGRNEPTSQDAALSEFAGVMKEYNMGA